MRCPRCQGRLVTETLGGRPAPPGGPYRSVEQVVLPEEAVQLILVDRCLGCQGVWFDEGEMADAIRRTRLRDLPRLPITALVRPKTLIGPCPRCGAVMETLPSRAVPEVEYDRCPRCRGVWFDAGEAEQFGDEHVELLALMIDEFG